MAEKEGRGTPDQKTAAPTAEAPVAPASSLTQDFATKVANAKSPNEVRAVMAENRAAMEAAVAKAKATPPVDKPPGAEIPPDLKAAAAEETPAPAPEEQADPAPEEAAPAQEETPEDDAADGDDGPVSPIVGKRTHLRLAPDDKVGRLAASFMKRNRDLPMTEAVEMARNQLGIKAPAAEPAPAPDAAPKSDLPQTVEAVDAQIKALRADRKKATVELRFEEASDMSDKLEDLIQHKFNLERDGERQLASKATAYEAAFTKSEARAAELYEFAGNPESPGAKRMLEIEADLKANGDPLYDSPDKPLRVAQMVASELSIAPRRKGVPAKAPTPAAPPASQKKQVLPAGDSRTTPAPVNQKPAIDTKVQAIKSISDLRNLRKEMGLPV